MPERPPNDRGQRREPAADDVRVDNSARRLAPVRCTAWFCALRSAPANSPCDLRRQCPCADPPIAERGFPSPRTNISCICIIVWSTQNQTNSAQRGVCAERQTQPPPPLSGAAVEYLETIKGRPAQAKPSGPAAVGWSAWFCVPSILTSLARRDSPKPAYRAHGCSAYFAKCADSPLRTRGSSGLLRAGRRCPRRLRNARPRRAPAADVSRTRRRAGRRTTNSATAALERCGR